MPRFQTVIRRARFVYSPYTAYEMQVFAQVLADSIRARIQSGQNIYDQAEHVVLEAEDQVTSSGMPRNRRPSTRSPGSTRR